MKYVFLKDIATGIEYPFICPENVNHDEFAVVCMSLLEHNNISSVPSSAGFVEAKYNCSGKSETLNISSRNTDGIKLTFNSSIQGNFEILPETVKATLTDKYNQMS